METVICDVECDSLDTETAAVWILSVQDVATGHLQSYGDHDPELPPLSEGIACINAADRVVGHNWVRYDAPVLRRYGYAADPEKIIDTLVLSRLGNPERLGGHSLANWGDELGSAKQEHEEWDRYSPEMRRRCETDVALTAKVWARLEPMLRVMPKAVELEHQVAWQVWAMYQNGFKLDVPYVQGVDTQLTEIIQQLERELREVFPPILVPKGKPKTLKIVNRRHPLYGHLEAGQEYQPMELQEFSPGSRQQIADRLIKRYGWVPSERTPSGQPKLDETIVAEMDYPEAPLLLKYLKATKAQSFISSPIKSNGDGGGWLERLSPDGRVRAHVNPNGTVTGRPSCSKPNLQQVFTDQKLKPFGLPSLRRAWIPKVGWVLVGCDAEGIELRGLGHFLFPYDNGAYVKAVCEGSKDDGTDVHSRAQVALGFYDRNQVKREEYGYLYGAGDPKLGLIQQQDAQLAGKPINFAALGIKPTKSLRAIGKAARARLEESLNATELVEDLKDTAKRQGFVRGIDRRKLRIRSLHSALNTILQSAGGIIMKQAIALAPEVLAAGGLVYGKHWRWCMWVHDEVQIEADPDVAMNVGERLADCIRLAGLELNFRCPLAGNYAIGKSWQETH